MLLALLALGSGIWLVSRISGPELVSPPGKIETKPVVPLSPVVRRIVVDGPSTPYLKLNYVIKELSVRLVQPDIDALLQFITQPKPGAFSEGEWGSLTNDIQEALTVQNVPNEKVAGVLIATYRDPSRSQLMRDYALQHIGGFAIHLVHTRKSANHPPPEFFDSLVSELIAAASDSSKPWCGTSLNLLDGLLRAAEYARIEVRGVSAERLCALALPVVKDENAPLNARLPALQLLSRHRSPQSVEMARGILSEGDSKLMLVQSACAVIGQTGDLSDLPLLQKIRETGGIHKSPAAIAAMAKLRQRFSN
ncbi:MAG: hypothetical protein QM680_12455 [Luteolibacter sp.]